MFQAHAEKEMQAFFQKMEYNRCSEALRQAVKKMTNDCKHLWMSGAPFVHKEWENHPAMTEGLAFNKQEVLYLHLKVLILFLAFLNN